MVLMALLPFSALGAGNFSLDGYYKNFSVVYSLPEISFAPYALGDGELGSVSNRLRVETGFRYRPVTVQAAYAVVPRIQDHAFFGRLLLPLNPDPYGYRVTDFDALLYPDDVSDARSFGIYHNLDRALLSLSLPWADIYVGRQAIAWGSARVINPTDVIAPYAFTELDTEYRIGVDAVRMRVPIGFMGEIDLGYVGGEDFAWDKSAAFARGKYYLWQTDMSAMIVAFRENLMIGVDVARSVGGAGVWVEMAHVIGDALNSRDDSSYFRATLGADYAFGEKSYGFVEYHFNGPGSNYNEDYLGLFDKIAYREGNVYLLGKHYLIPGFTYNVTPLFSATGEALVNLGDPSLVLIPSIDYNIAENVYIGGGGYIAMGKGVRRIGPFAFVESEFGMYPDIYYLSFRIYF